MMAAVSSMWSLDELANLTVESVEEKQLRRLLQLSLPGRSTGFESSSKVSQGTDIHLRSSPALLACLPSTSFLSDSEQYRFAGNGSYRYPVRSSQSRRLRDSAPVSSRAVKYPLCRRFRQRVNNRTPIGSDRGDGWKRVERPKRCKEEDQR